MVATTASTDRATTLEACRILDDRDTLPGSLSAFMEAGWHALEPGVDFVSGWAVGAVCEHLEAVTRGEIRRLLINVPPGCTKSMTVNVFWPAWEWTQPERRHYRYISLSHEHNLAMRDLVRCRDLLLSEWYQQRWPFEFKPDQNAKSYYENASTGWRYASSVGAGLTGYRGDRLIVDDPNSPKGAESDTERENVLRWFSETLPTRLNKLDESAIVVIMQRVHERDVAGLILEKELGYTHLCLPMEYEPDHPFRWPKDRRRRLGQLLWPERFPRRAVGELKKSLRSWGGTYAEAGQLQQRPAPRGGGMFKVGDFEVTQERAKKARRVRGWDLAATKDGHGARTASVLIAIDAKGHVTIEDAEAFRAGPGEVKRRIAATAERDGHSVEISLPQDPGQAGKAQKADLAALLHGFNVHFSPETGSKEDRARPLAAQVEAGNVSLLEASWNKPFLDEVGSFPMGARDDQVDASSRSYARLIMKKRRRVAGAPRILKEARS